MPGVLNAKGAGWEQERGLLLERPQGHPQNQRAERSEGLDASTGAFTALEIHTGPTWPRCRSQSHVQHQVCLSAASALCPSSWHLARWPPSTTPPAPPAGTDPSRPHRLAQQDHSSLTEAGQSRRGGDGPYNMRGDKPLSRASRLPVGCAGDQGIPVRFHGFSRFHRKPAQADPPEEFHPQAKGPGGLGPGGGGVARRCQGAGGGVWRLCQAGSPAARWAGRHPSPDAAPGLDRVPLCLG